MAVMQLLMCWKCFPLGMYQIWAKYGTNVQQRSHLVPLRWVGPRTSAASFDLDFHHHCSSVSKKKQYTWVSLWRWTRRQCWGWWQGGQGFRGTRSGLGGSTIYFDILVYVVYVWGKCEALFGDIQVCSLGEYLSTLEVDPALRVVFQLQKTLRSFL